MSFGPRIVGTAAHAEAEASIVDSLEALGWETTVHTAVYRGVELHNLVGKRGTSADGPIVIGAHYDTRPVSDRDPIDPEQPVPGANDGASGVAVLLELARVLPSDLRGREIWLAFFDGEDSGGLDSWEWSAGAAAFAADLTITPQAVVILDMVGGVDMQIRREATSDVSLLDEIWTIADTLGADVFVPEIGVPIMDDHRPFLDRGIPPSTSSACRMRTGTPRPTHWIRSLPKVWSKSDGWSTPGSSPAARPLPQPCLDVHSPDSIAREESWTG